MIDIAGQAKCLIIDEVYFQSTDAGIGARAGDLVLEVFLELEGPCRLARRRVAWSASQRISLRGGRVAGPEMSTSWVRQST